MLIIETSIFTRQVLKHLSDDEYCQLQYALIMRPDLGAEIPGAGGLRKARWGIEGRGKRGGLRIIYYWIISEEKLLILLMYTKNEQDDLTVDQIKILRRLVGEELR